MANQFFALSWEKVNDRHFHQGVAAWLLAHGGACGANEHLAGEAGLLIFMSNEKSWFCVFPLTPFRVR